MVKKPQLSVIVPVYNAENTIVRCVESILNQTMDNLEIILINDGSQDSSGQICDDFALQDMRVKVVHKKNGGAASARNMGLDYAIGEYIGFCDADDYLDLDMYKTLLDVMKENNLTTIECLANVYSDVGDIIETASDSRTLQYVSEEEGIKKIYLRTGGVHLGTRVTKAEYIKNIRIPEGKRVEDFYFTIQLLTITKGTTLYSYPFYNYVINGGSVTHSGGGGIYIDAIDFYEKSVEYLNNDIYATEQNYYLLKMYYLFFVSANQEEFETQKFLIKQYKKIIREKWREIFLERNLRKKEKVVLLLASFSTGFIRFLAFIKKGNEGR